MIKKKKQKEITLKELAAIVTKGFDCVDKNLDELARMVKNGFVASDENLHREVGKLRTEMNGEMNKLRTDMNNNFDRLEKFTLDDHQLRIHYLEVELKHLKDIFALK